MGLGTISLFLVGSKSNVSAFFRLQFRNGLGTKPAGALLFRMRSPSTFFFGFALFLLIFSRFLKQRFGIFQAAVSQWLGHKTCWGSAFSHALPKHLFLGFCVVFVYLFIFSGFLSNVSAFFRLQFRNGLSTKPAGALLFRMRSPSTFFLGFGQGFALFLLILVGSKSNVSAFFRL